MAGVAVAGGVDGYLARAGECPLNLPRGFFFWASLI